MSPRISAHPGERRATGALRAVAAAGIVLAVALPLAACSGSGSNKSGTTPSATSSIVPTRWWSNTAVTAGSTIDPKHPAAATASLKPSEADYCRMLSDTVAAGKSILPGIGSTDPALLVSTEAFIAELTQTAPSAVSDAWKQLGPVVIALVKSGGAQSALPSMDAGAVQQAATLVAAHALKTCKVDVSSAAKGSSGTAGTASATASSSP